MPKVSLEISIFFISFLLFVFLSFKEFSLFFSFLTFCLFLSVHSNQQSTAFATIVSEALFYVSRDTYFSTLFGVCPTFRSRITAIILFFLFYVDS